MTSYDIISRYVPENIRTAMSFVKENMRTDITEIRLRSGRAVSFVYPDRILSLGKNGHLSGNFSSDSVIATPENIAEVVRVLAHYSLHSCEKQLEQGCFVIEGGIRAGIAGTYSGKCLSSFSGVNFRLCRCVKGCAERIFRYMSGRKKSILICGGVNSGKTTILRDLCRLCGNSFKVSLIDERNEISFLSGGTPLNDVGEYTDIITGCTRAEGIESAIRTLSPEMIFCDEIAGSRDVSAILSGAGSGVLFAAAMHAEDHDSLMKRQAARELISAGVFETAVFLCGADSPAKIKEIRRLENVSQDNSSSYDNGGRRISGCGTFRKSEIFS